MAMYTTLLRRRYIGCDSSQSSEIRDLRFDFLRFYIKDVKIVLLLLLYNQIIIIGCKKCVFQLVTSVILLFIYVYNSGVY